MLPPPKLNVLDQHGGFTAATTPHTTIWRPGAVLKGKSPIGVLVRFDTNSFYQNSPPGTVTEATYKIKGYRYLIVAWFDNATNRRIA